jgi:hypothetical protein
MAMLSNWQYVLVVGILFLYCVSLKCMANGLVAWSVRELRTKSSIVQILLSLFDLDRVLRSFP